MIVKIGELAWTIDYATADEIKKNLMMITQIVITSESLR